MHSCSSRARCSATPSVAAKTLAQWTTGASRQMPSFDNKSIAVASSPSTCASCANNSKLSLHWRHTLPGGSLERMEADEVLRTFDVAERELRERRDHLIVTICECEPIDSRNAPQCLFRLTEQQQAHRRLGVHRELKVRDMTVLTCGVGHLVESLERRRNIALEHACSTDKSHEPGAQQVGVQPGLGQAGEVFESPVANPGRPADLPGRTSA
jgi:hypothetical protein